MRPVNCWTKYTLVVERSSKRNINPAFWCPFISIGQNYRKKNLFHGNSPLDNEASDFGCTVYNDNRSSVVISIIKVVISIIKVVELIIPEGRDRPADCWSRIHISLTDQSAKRTSISVISVTYQENNHQPFLTKITSIGL